MGDFLPDAAKILAEYAKNPNFVLTCIFTWFLCEAIFDIDTLEKVINGYKRIVAMAIGAVIGTLIIETSVMGLIAGAIAGGLTTYLVGRLDKWLGGIKVTTINSPEPTEVTAKEVSVAPPAVVTTEDNKPNA